MRTTKQEHYVTRTEFADEQQKVETSFRRAKKDTERNRVALVMVCFLCALGFLGVVLHILG